MFVVTMKWNKKTALIVILSVAALLCALILLSRRDQPMQGAEQKLGGNDDREAYLESLGWQVDNEPVGEKQVVIPREFSAVYEEYNRLQLAQGYDLSQYCGMQATIFTYAIHNYEGYVGNVVADLYIHEDVLIGGDIHSLALDGFMHGLKKP